ncbi:YolD-like family protein [Sporosarcina sp. Sa2YVA2]|uniref:YolD-like family protein n=1 Tax=Sporosarcina quadrami TaxID=2762234 RepID=A0ABR8UD35_9BACL|nr:YolD-like family protein [Sporosarcina quadrami]MBD7985938.1 YolD-like family protein [Sporosarcina quadrami]
MLRDRGRIKWTAMMLPEHIAQLRDWQKEDDFEQRQQPDEQQLEEWNLKFQQALLKNWPVEIHYWKGFVVLTTKGFIQKTDMLEGIIHIKSEAGLAQRIPFVDIKSISDFE